jgi:hypothetical protein
MGRYDLAPEHKQSIEDAARRGDIGRAVEIANHLIWDSFNRDASGDRIDWMPMASEKRVREILMARPKILNAVPEKVLATLNFAAVIGELLGPQYRESEWLPAELELDLPMTKSAAVSMFKFCARHYEQIAVFSKAGFDKIKISVCHNADGRFPPCAICETLTDTSWTAETIPELPYEKCVNGFGCRCLALADI